MVDSDDRRHCSRKASAARVYHCSLSMERAPIRFDINDVSRMIRANALAAAR